MLIKQISVFLENKSGRLAEVTKILWQNNIDISALSIADTTDFGILRLIVSNPDIAERVLKDNEFTVSSTNVIAIGVEDKPGGLYKALGVLEKGEIGIEYMYAFVGKTSDQAMVIIRVDDSDKAIDILAKNGIKVLSSDSVYKL